MPSRPAYNDGVYCHGREQPNGKIINIVWGCDEPVVVKYYDGSVESYSLEDFQEFHPKFKQWFL